MPHFFAPGLRLFDRPLTWDEWRAFKGLGTERRLMADKEPKRSLKDPETGILPISEWGPACATGWVRDARFGSGQVIKGTSRAKSRKNMALNTWENAR
jgi:hypothetical protein